jgi:hypothetical protein
MLCPALFRMGVHALPIEMGRWHGVPSSKQIGDMCDTSAVGDKHHFVVANPALGALEQTGSVFVLSSRTLRVSLIWQPD